MERPLIELKFQRLSVPTRQTRLKIANISFWILKHWWKIRDRQRIGKSKSLHIALIEIYKERPLKQQFDKKDLLEDKFLQTCLILLKTCLEENNMATYLLSVDATSIFFAQTLSSDTVHGSLQSMVTPIILRTTDTNTRIRKKSVDLIYQIWDFIPETKKDKLKLNQFRDSQDEGQAKHDSFC